MRSLDFSIDLILPAALWSTQSPTETSARNLPGGKGLPALKADNLTAINEPITSKIWEPRRLTPDGPPRPVTGIALPFINSHTTKRSIFNYVIWGCYRGPFTA
jgi:hypothetical protein